MFEDATTLEEAVYNAIGAASTAWCDGVFDTVYAEDIAQSLLAAIAKFERGEVIGK